MGGKTVLITGGTSGIGKATAMALAAMGANVVVVGRNQERGEAAVEEISARSHNESVDLLLADLSVQSEVDWPKSSRPRQARRARQQRRAGAEQTYRDAGRHRDDPGHKPSGAVLAHEPPARAAEKSAPSRVITVSSEAQRWGTMNFDDMQSRRKYRGFPSTG